MADSLKACLQARYAPGLVSTLWVTTASRPEPERFAAAVAGRWERAAGEFLEGLRALAVAPAASQEPLASQEAAGAAGAAGEREAAPGTRRRALGHVPFGRPREDRWLASVLFRAAPAASGAVTNAPEPCRAEEALAIAAGPTPQGAALPGLVAPGEPRSSRAPTSTPAAGPAGAPATVVAVPASSAASRPRGRARRAAPGTPPRFAATGSGAPAAPGSRRRTVPSELDAAAASPAGSHFAGDGAPERARPAGTPGPAPLLADPRREALLTGGVAPWLEEPPPRLELVAEPLTRGALEALLEERRRRRDALREWRGKEF